MSKHPHTSPNGFTTMRKQPCVRSVFVLVGSWQLGLIDAEDT